MEYLILIGLIPALVMNHVVYLCKPHTGVNARIRTAVPVVLLAVAGALWLASRVGSDIDVSFTSAMLWLQALVYAVMSSVAVQSLYLKNAPVS
jgi:hypothetical protein